MKIEHKTHNKSNLQIIENNFIKIFNKFIDFLFIF